MAKKTELTEKRKEFCNLLLENPEMRPSVAYAEAGFAVANSVMASAEANKLLKDPKIRLYLAGNRKLITRKAGVKPEAIVEELLLIHQANPDELSSIWRTACRYCWSFGYGYMRTPEEFKRDRKAHEAAEAANAALEPAKRRPASVFDEQGGDGFNCIADPDPDCTECRGLGVLTTVLKDTRKLSRGARALYAGVHVTKDGVKVLTHSKEGFTTLLMRHTGMLVDKRELSGPNGSPLQVQPVAPLPADPVEAAREYARIMGDAA